MPLSQGIMREKLTSERVQNGDGPEGEMVSCIFGGSSLEDWCF